MIHTSTNTQFRGFSLVELIVAVGLFTIIMTLASGAYLVMIGINRQAQGIATGINNLSFALETMMYNIRTGTNYDCGGLNDCQVNSFSFTNSKGRAVTYRFSGTSIQEEKEEITGGTTISTLTDSSMSISTLTFYVFGAAKPPAGDYSQPRVTIIVHGTVSTRPGRPPELFTVQTGATMRGTDL